MAPSRSKKKPGDLGHLAFILEFCTAKSFPIGMAPAHYWVGLRYLKTVFSLAAIGAIDE
jgi:hypothetical protein